MRLSGDAHGRADLRIPLSSPSTLGALSRAPSQCSAGDGVPTAVCNAVGHPRARTETSQRPAIAQARHRTASAHGIHDVRRPAGSQHTSMRTGPTTGGRSDQSDDPAGPARRTCGAGPPARGSACPTTAETSAADDLQRARAQLLRADRIRLQPRWRRAPASAAGCPRPSGSRPDPGACDLSGGSFLRDVRRPV
jgi:hypothetical protein